MSKKVIYLILGLSILVGIAVGAMAINRNRQQNRNDSQFTQTSDPKNQSNEQTTSNSQSSQPGASLVTWRQSDNGWQASGTPPACPDPLNLPTPADISKATAILYPGQTRGGDYKAHGGFRFDGTKNDAVTVTAPLEATVLRGTRYKEIGEEQYLFDFIAPCGIMYRLDHLRTLSPKFQQLADAFPPAGESTRTQNISSVVTVKAGESIATSVGFQANSNTSFDWGVYDLRQKNEASKNAAWAAQHGNEELAPYAICWLNELISDAATKVKSLPSGDPTSGKTSDYCK